MRDRQSVNGYVEEQRGKKGRKGEEKKKEKKKRNRRGRGKTGQVVVVAYSGRRRKRTSEENKHEGEGRALEEIRNLGVLLRGIMVRGE